jgi:CHAD domain-containing protein
MKKKTEKAYFDEQWEGMTTHLKAFIATNDQEELHLFRVQVKKIRAMLTLLDFASPKHQLLRGFKPVKKIFKHCGVIRNAHINLQLGARYHLNNEQFINSQQDIIENGLLEFKMQSEKYLKVVKSTCNDLRSGIRHIDNDSINDFYKRYLERALEAFSPLQFNEELHICRMQIKILMYNRKMAFKALEGKLPVNTAYLDKLQDNIGNWHDNVLAIELFSTPELRDELVITEIKKQNTRLKRAIATLAKDFEKKVILDDKATM